MFCFCNSQFQYPFHKSRPLYQSLSQMNPVHIPITLHIPRGDSPWHNPIWYLPCVLQARFISSSSFSINLKNELKIINYETPHCASFSTLLSFPPCNVQMFSLTPCRLRLKCDGTRAETRFRLSAKRTSPFKSAGA